MCFVVVRGDLTTTFDDLSFFSSLSLVDYDRLE